MKKFYALLVGLILLVGCATRGFPPTAAILNYDHVDQYVDRGAQPNQYGLEFLKGQHVTLVINLRDVGDTWVNEGQVCTNNGIKYLWVPLNGSHAPSKADVKKILAAIDAEIQAGGKVFFHCQHGCDRTGTIAACYEIQFKGESNADALSEANFYGMSKLEFGMRSFIKRYKSYDVRRRT
jgi:protein tyrosine/serine phosphatase